MSNPNFQYKEPSRATYKLNVIGFLGVLLLFAIIVGVAYLPNRPAPVNEDLVAERRTKVAEVNAKQQELVSEYAWVDKEVQVVRLPINRAMRLTVTDLQKPRASASMHVTEPGADNNL